MCFILKMNLILNEFCAKIIYNKSSNLFINKWILLMTNSTEAVARIKINEISLNIKNQNKKLFKYLT